jgi:spore coat polysaccharide biosynthesis predicted glycosyltransferase SpsG
MALERCSLGLPTLGIILAENQRAAASALGAAGACKVMGDPQFLDQKLPLELKKLSHQKELRKLQKKASAICDGDGVRRVTHVMLEDQYE